MAFGIKFEVELFVDVSFYELEVDVRTEKGSIECKVYTKTGSFANDYDDLAINGWRLVFNGTTEPADSHKIRIPLSSVQHSRAGSKRSFYISYPDGENFMIKDQVSQ